MLSLSLKSSHPIRPCICHRCYKSIHVESREESLGSLQEHILIHLGNRGYACAFQIGISNQGWRLHQLWLLRRSQQSKVDIWLCVRLCWQSNLMKVKNPGVHDSLHKRSQIHWRVWCNKGSNLATTTDGRLFDQEMNHPNHSDLALGLTDHNTPHVEPNLPCKEEAHKGEVSSYSGALHRQESWSLKDQHRGEHRRLPNQNAPRPSLQST